jgi:hypothetical protein
MAFSEQIRNQEAGEKFKCEVCGEPLAYFELHSATSLHLVLTEVDGEKKYLVTDPPQGHEQLRGKVLSVKIFSDGEKNHDGFCLCPVCHDELHRIALSEAQFDPDFKGNSPPPQLLLEVTLYFIARKKPIVYEGVE